MNIKSLIAITGIALGISFSLTATAKNVPIIFAKGSECGSFSGNVQGQTFILGLGKNQLFTVSPDDRSAYRVIVRDPSGHILRLNAGSMGGWTINQTGKHRINIIPFNKNNSYANIDFCAYS